MRALTILGVVCTMSACSIRAVTFVPPDAADAAGRGGETGADGGKDIVAVDVVARDVALEVAAPEAAQTRRPTSREMSWSRRLSIKRRPKRPSTPPVTERVMRPTKIDYAIGLRQWDSGGERGMRRGTF